MSRAYSDSTALQSAYESYKLHSTHQNGMEKAWTGQDTPSTMPPTSFAAILTSFRNRLFR